MTRLINETVLATHDKTSKMIFVSSMDSKSQIRYLRWNLKIISALSAKITRGGLCRFNAELSDSSIDTHALFVDFALIRLRFLEEKKNTHTQNNPF